MENAYIMFVALALTGPIVGVLIGGQVIQAYGGYNNPRSMYICLGLSVIASAVGLPLPFLVDYRVFMSFLWI